MKSTPSYFFPSCRIVHLFLLFPLIGGIFILSHWLVKSNICLDDRAQQVWLMKDLTHHCIFLKKKKHEKNLGQSELIKTNYCYTKFANFNLKVGPFIALLCKWTHCSLCSWHHDKLPCEDFIIVGETWRTEKIVILHLQNAEPLTLAPLIYQNHYLSLQLLKLLFIHFSFCVAVIAFSEVMHGGRLY